MQDFGAFCYMDVEKTGSSFITHILKHVSTQKLLMSSQHGTIKSVGNANAWSRIFFSLCPIKLKNSSILFSRYKNLGGVFRDDCFYFNSVRNPFNYYASLYNFGCDGNGGIADILNRNGFGYLYDNTEGSFLRWVEFILDPRNAHFIDHSYKKTCSDHVGFLTYRFLRLSMVDPFHKLCRVKNKSEVQCIFDRHSICDYTVRNEFLDADLAYLFSNNLKKFIRHDAIFELCKDGKINRSHSKRATAQALRESDLSSLVLERDFFIFSNYYPM